MFLVHWTASVVNEVWEHRQNLGDVRRLITACLTVLVIVYGFGLMRLHNEKPVENVVRVAGVTPGPEYRAKMMEIFGEIFSGSRTGIFDEEGLRASIEIKYQELVSTSERMADSGVEIVAWSEAATFVFESDEEVYIQQAVQSAKEHAYYLAMGLIVLNDNCQSLLADNQPIVKNKIIFIAPDGQIAWEYSKFNLAPGFERAMTIPGDGLLKLSNTTQGMVTGAICYDMDFPQYIRQAGLLKSNLIIAPANDWPEIKNTHAKMARLRAIENGVSMLRPSNSGISTAVDPYGNIISLVDDVESNGAPLVAVLPTDSVQTLYVTLGDFLIWVCAFGAIVLFALGVVRSRKRTV